jgi:hypothetical protein
MSRLFSQLKSSRTAFARLVMLIVLAGCSSGGELAAPPTLGSLDVSISGLPANAVASVTVNGPDGFSRALSSGAMLSSLTAGTYVVTVNEVWHEGSAYAGTPAIQAITVTTGGAAVSSTVLYALATGSVSIALAGLPDATPASLTLTGPDAFHRTVTQATHIVGLRPGVYAVEAGDVSTSSATYTASQGSQYVHVEATAAPAVVNVAYNIASGAIALSVTGLPAGEHAMVTVTGPANFSSTITSSTATLTNLAPGVYTIDAASVSNGSVFIPTPATQQVVVSASAQPFPASVNYASAATALNVQVLGLPSGVNGSVTVAGPNGYNALVASTKVLSAIPAGTYTISAAAVTLSCNSVAPTQKTQLVNVAPGQAASVSVTYSSAAAGLNLCIEGAHVTQAVQTFAGDVPLVAGRDGLLRVFVRASGTNSATPSVRARFYSNTTLMHTILIPAPSASVPTTINEASLNASWNAPLPGTLLQAGLKMVVDVDPSNLIAESSENDNSHSSNGSPIDLDIRSVPTLGVRLIPVIQGARGDTGRVGESNKATFVGPMMKMFPVPGIDADLRAPYVFNGPELQAGGGHWTTLLSELNAVRVAEGSARMYYGVVRVGYTSGVAGLGYIGAPTAIGWDHQPSGPEVMAHELGHNFGRLHAPCGGPAGVDNQFPYSGATIGAFGYDLSGGALKTPVLRDLMSYCDPSWISDYTYKAILNYRESFPMKGGAVTTGTRESGLLVWGRIEQGRVILEPGFEVDAPPSLPSRSGPYQLSGLGSSGESLFSISFAGERVADSPNGDDETFAFVIPMAALRGVDLDRLRLSARGRQVEMRSSGGGALPTAQRMANGRVRLTWDGAAGRAALVRDAGTGAIISIARGGSVELPGAGTGFEVTVSDGVKSRKTSLRPR